MLDAAPSARAESVVFTVVDCPPIVSQVMRVLGIYDLLTGGAATP